MPRGTYSETARTDVSRRGRYNQLARQGMSRLQRFAIGTCKSGGYSREVAKDLVQDTLTTAWLLFSTLSDDCKFDSWARSILRHHFSNYRRKFLRERSSPRTDETDQATPVKMMENDVICALDLEWLLTLLKPVERRVLLLHYIAGFSIAEISIGDHCSVNATSKRLERSRSRLRHLAEVGHVVQVGIRPNVESAAMEAMKSSEW